MLIQNIGSASAAPGLASDGAPAAVVAPPSPPAQPQQAAAAPQPTKEQLQSALNNVNRAMAQSNSNVQFSLDQSTKQTVIKVVDSSSGEVVRQFPSEAILAVSQMIENEQKKGMLLQQEA